MLSTQKYLQEYSIDEFTRCKERLVRGVYSKSEQVEFFSKLVVYLKDESTRSCAKVWYVLEILHLIFCKFKSEIEQGLSEEYTLLVRCISRPFLDLPIEILDQIFSYISSSSLLRLQLTCRTVKIVARGVFERNGYMQKYVDEALYKNRPIESTYRSNAEIIVSLKGPNLKESPLLTLSPDSQTIPIFKNFPKIKGLEYHYALKPLPKGVSLKTFLMQSTAFTSLFIRMDTLVFDPDENPAETLKLLCEQKDLESLTFLQTSNEAFAVHLNLDTLIYILNGCKKLRELTLGYSKALHTFNVDIREQARVYEQVKVLKGDIGCLNKKDLPFFLKMFPALETLELNYCDNLSSKTFKVLSGFSHLKSLSLSYSYINKKMFDAVMAFTNLQELFLTRVNISSEEIKQIETLQKLRVFVLKENILSSNKIRYILSTCSSLEVFDLRKTKIYTKQGECTYSDSIRALDSLRELYLSHCLIDKQLFVDILEKSPRLRVLHLIGQKDLSHTFFTAIKKVQSLKTLKLSQIQLQDAILELKCLTSLSISRCSLGSIDLSLFTTLRKVNLSWSDVTDDAFTKLAFWNKNLKRMRLNGIEKVTENGLRSLYGCKRLRALFLDGTSITDDVAVGLLENLPKLKKLSLASCQNISESGLDVKQPHKKIRSLFLSKTRISLDHLYKILSMFPRLQEVRHDGCYDEEESLKFQEVKTSFPTVFFTHYSS